MADMLLNRNEKKIKIFSGFFKYNIYFDNSINKIFHKFPKNCIILADQKVKNFLPLNKKYIFLSASEKLKSFENLHKIIKKLLKLKITRTTTIVVIGGGTIQDACSFISSVIFRGIKWIYLPTTLLSQCDSCIGGKTSINFYGHKNQIGNFYPPKKIYINLNFIKKQNRSNLLSGLGEMSHYYFLSSKKDFDFFNKHILKALQNYIPSLEKLIYRSLKIKKKYIEIDEFDNGKRLILNYGHSFGHAIEKASNYSIPHGIAVANGMKIANYISNKKNFLNLKNYKIMNKTLNMITSPNDLDKINPNKIMNALEKDKKNNKKSIRLILSKGIGKMFIFSLDRKKKINLMNFLMDYFKRYNAK